MKAESQREESRIETVETASAISPTEDQVGSAANNGVAPEIDDRGTDQTEASQILRNIRDKAFDSSDEKLALVLGRPTEEIAEWTSGAGTIDGDVLMKARALALERGTEIE